MAFSTAAFVCVFLPLVLSAHTMARKTHVQNTLLAMASALFYSAGSLAFLPLLAAIAGLNFIASCVFQHDKFRCRPVLAAVVILNIMPLVMTKYLDFFTLTINQVFSVSIPILNLTLPIGISFFTFQGMSYAIDVYRKPEIATRSFFAAFLYLSFFPQLVAGPIVKFDEICDQLKVRTITLPQLTSGTRRFIFGLSKKLLIADILAELVDGAFAADAALNGPLAIMASIGYSLQIYFDFSGYSDMAIGMGMLFGFKLPENFRYPYAASSVRDFWKRWHISLSSWFREYVYIPLGGNRKGIARTCANVMIVFLLTGLWHGANWTFVLWGLWHGLWSVAERTTPLGKLQGHITGHILTLIIVVLGFVFFRANSVTQAVRFVKAMFGGCPSSQAAYLLQQTLLQKKVIAAGVIGLFLSSGVQVLVWNQLKSNAIVQVSTYFAAIALLLMCMLRLAAGSFNPFIYFQF